MPGNDLALVVFEGLLVESRRVRLIQMDEGGDVLLNVDLGQFLG